MVVVNPLGPYQLYVTPVLVALKLRFCPEQMGALLAGAGEAGATSMVTAVVPAAPVHPATVTLTEYVPEAAVVTEVMDGSSSEEVKLSGPVQL